MQGTKNANHATEWQIVWKYAFHLNYRLDSENVIFSVAHTEGNFPMVFFLYFFFWT